jgi:hypothetical protein
MPVFFPSGDYLCLVPRVKDNRHAPILHQYPGILYGRSACWVSKKQPFSGLLHHMALIEL